MTGETLPPVASTVAAGAAKDAVDEWAVMIEMIGAAAALECGCIGERGEAGSGGITSKIGLSIASRFRFAAADAIFVVGDPKATLNGKGAAAMAAADAADAETDAGRARRPAHEDDTEAAVDGATRAAAP